MSHIRVLICRVDDPASEQMTELAAFDLPVTDVFALRPETALDELETTTTQRAMPSSVARSRPNGTSSMLN
jgi:hypothetical protein